MEKNKSIYAKLLSAQKKIASIKKKSENPFYKSKYADINEYLSVVKPILNEFGLVIFQPLTIRDGKNALKTMIIDSESEKDITSVVILPEGADAQKQGAIITYFRRYAIQSLLSLEAEDDDGNSASVKTGATEKVSTEKECPICHKRHTGQYFKCLECFKSGAEAPKTKTVINNEAEPF